MTVEKDLLTGLGVTVKELLESHKDIEKVSFYEIFGSRPSLTVNVDSIPEEWLEREVINFMQGYRNTCAITVE